MQEARNQVDENTSGNGRNFLEKLRSREALSESARIAVVVAHPDDESIAFGAQIARFPECLMIHVTDGAPQNSDEWKGFQTQAEYAAVRRQELGNALDIAGHTGIRESLDVPDQETAFRLADVSRKLAQLFIEHNVTHVLTHAYEGGHVDHDATAFAVHAVRKILAKKRRALAILEAPFYRAEGTGNVVQDFTRSEESETFVFPLSDDERALKERLFAAHKSQGETFSELAPSTTTEWLREAPEYDFRKLPNDGKLSDIFTYSGIGAHRWIKLTRGAYGSLKIGKQK